MVFLPVFKCELWVLSTTLTITKALSYLPHHLTHLLESGLRLTFFYYSYAACFMCVSVLAAAQITPKY